MSEDKKEPWMNYLALTAVLLAVSTTLSTFKGGLFYFSNGFPLFMP